MDFDRLLQKKEQLARVWDTIPQVAREKLERSFDIEYAHNSTAIEGNTLTLIQTKAILEDGLSVGGKTLREIYEVANHNKAFDYVKQCVAEGRPLDEPTVKDIHALLMEISSPAAYTATWRCASRARVSSLLFPERCTSK